MASGEGLADRRTRSTFWGLPGAQQPSWMGARLPRCVDEDPFCFAELFSSSQSRLGERKLGREGMADRG